MTFCRNLCRRCFFYIYFCLLFLIDCSRFSHLLVDIREVNYYIVILIVISVLDDNRILLLVQGNTSRVVDVLITSTVIQCILRLVLSISRVSWITIQVSFVYIANIVYFLNLDDDWRRCLHVFPVHLFCVTQLIESLLQSTLAKEEPDKGNDKQQD